MNSRRTTHWFCLQTLVAFFLMMGMLLPYPACATIGVAVITARSSATVDGDSVLLGDVAAITVNDPVSKEKLSNIKIQNAPLPGQSRWVHPEEIKQRLKQFGVQETQYQLSVKGPVKVIRRHAVVSPKKVNAAVKRYIQHNAPWQPEQLKIDRLTYNNDLIVPSGKVSLAISTPKHTDWIGPIPFNVNVLVDGKKIKRIVAPATIEVWSDVVLTAKPLGRYQPINADDIVVQKMNLARAPANAVVDPAQVIGHRTNRSIVANSILRSDQVEMPPVVKRGDIVQIIAESTILKVAAKGMAKENGVKGERIQVMNLRSKRIIYAQVVDEQTVQVEF